MQTHAIELGQRRTANGGSEWFLIVGGEPVYGPGGVGLFTGPEVDAHRALPRVLAQVGKRP